MKKYKILYILFVSIWMLQPIQAKESDADNIILMSEHIPYIIYAKITSDTAISIHFIPTNIVMPLSCANAIAAPLSSLPMKDKPSCIKTSIENFFDIPIDNTIYLHMDAISKDTGISMDTYDFNNISDLTAFFEKVADNVDLSMILRYRSYIDSDLGISSFYKYYKRRNQPYTLQFHFMQYMMLDSVSIPMDNAFHNTKR